MKNLSGFLNASGLLRRPGASRGFNIGHSKFGRALRFSGAPMNTSFSSAQAERPAIVKLLWAGAAVLALALTSIALSVPHGSGARRASATRSTGPAVTDLNRIDHSHINWDKVPADPKAAGTSLAAYGSGT